MARTPRYSNIGFKDSFIDKIKEEEDVPKKKYKDIKIIRRRKSRRIVKKSKKTDNPISSHVIYKPLTPREIDKRARKKQRKQRKRVIKASF